MAESSWTSPLLMSLRRDLLIALAALAMAFTGDLVVGSSGQNVLMLFGRVNIFDLALCAFAAVRATHARQAYLRRTHRSSLPRNENVLWLGTLVLIGIQLLTTV
ncbi:hypothetical protein GCM10008955_40230 [Deinococcus malanensis]|uniref:DUF5658 domain-containing protein n=1 Tax=Deinococcus malanensis TaxID=1706855 RepID=A0ABQ2F5B1_9DEIO|nr:hypothetical protein [Deinococcus malanensis]GGK42417.1 hypothetical protein GCM10008955_40230 [Deinococcus malanensis]